MRLVSASLTALLVAAPALAQHNPQLDQKLNLGSFQVAGPDAPITVTIDVGSNPNPVVGFSMSFDFSDPTNSFAYASDMKMTIAPNTGPSVVFGGFDNPGQLWDFDGFGSDGSGHYESGPHYVWEAGIPKDGIWKFTIDNDWNPSPAVGYNNISVTLHKVPEPATLSLLALSGLALIRRR